MLYALPGQIEAYDATTHRARVRPLVLGQTGCAIGRLPSVEVPASAPLGVGELCVLVLAGDDVVAVPASEEV